ncbi:MAG: hypothetical protein U5K79_18810 [Cyclobacteriaceae bacterium]|nr:hypothetical protein [Cyclobacteriaceae bacterium]
MTFDDFFDFNSARARVFLLREGDQKSMALLSDSGLLVIYKGKRHLFQTESIKQCRAEDKRLLFPLIVGGIMAPFAFLSFLIHPMQPWVHLVSIIAGMVLFYIGWTGKPAMVILLKNKEEVIFYLPSISMNLQAFMDFANMMISPGNKQLFSSLIYIELPVGSESLFNTEQPVSTLFPLFGYTYQQLSARMESMTNLIAIDPMQSGREIKFEYDSATQLFRPQIDGPLRPESRVEIPSWIK